MKDHFLCNLSNITFSYALHFSRNKTHRFIVEQLKSFRGQEMSQDKSTHQQEIDEIDPFV